MKIIDENGEEEADDMPDIPSSIPFLPPVVSFETTLWYFHDKAVSYLIYKNTNGAHILEQHFLSLYTVEAVVFVFVMSFDYGVC